MNLLKKIIYWKLSLQFFLITNFRNKLYDLGLIKSHTFTVPVISVGNLSVGGTGKTPMIEFLIKNFSLNYNVGVLSRGYKRNSKGFILASEIDNAKSIGDEPFQFFTKFKNIKVAVDKKRKRGIKRLIKEGVELILLDDAFQHRRVKPDYSILLSEYGNLYYEDYLMPRGKLRESKKGARRADCIIITKCPSNISSEAKDNIIKLIKPRAYQKLFFSSIEYSENIFSLNGSKSLHQLMGQHINLVTGIVNSEGLKKYLDELGLIVHHHAYPDHHAYSKKDISFFSDKTIITTEKDFTKLRTMDINNLFYLPIKTKIHERENFLTHMSLKI